MNDGTNYYGVYADSTVAQVRLVQVPAAGTSKVDMLLSSINPIGSLDAYLQANAVVWAVIRNDTQPPEYGVNALDGAVLTAAAALGTNPAVSGSRTITAMDGGSSTLVSYFSHSSTASCRIIRKKVFNTAIMGVADYAASAGQTVGVLYTAGAYRASGLNLSAPLTFDHLATNIPGNKGTLLPISAVLKGF